MLRPTICVPTPGFIILLDTSCLENLNQVFVVRVYAVRRLLPTLVLRLTAGAQRQEVPRGTRAPVRAQVNVITGSPGLHHVSLDLAGYVLSGDSS